MFEAIRTKLVGAWKDLRSRGLVSLFFFELVVVTLGVLLAQAIAELASDRAADRAMETERQRALENVAASAGNAQVWRAALPCLEKRVTDLMIAVTEGRSVPSSRLVRPSMPSFLMELPTEESFTRYVDRYGVAQGDTLHGVQRGNVILTRRVDAITDTWQSFGMVDEGRGPVGPEDRRAVREASNEILGLLEGIEITSRFLLDNARKLGVDPRPYNNRHPIRSCDEMWSQGAIFVELPEGSSR